MAKAKVKVYPAGAMEHLGDSPFLTLRGGPTPAGQTAPVPPAEEAIPGRPAFMVARTRKGGWPLRIEKRGGGKVVTVLAGVSGDGTALLRTLKALCGAGGTQRDQEIEIQGDHGERIARWLDSNAPSRH
jgi:translation initiation factor 1 (eIF-1/SUI1)